jgi:hypothetical protein
VQSKVHRLVAVLPTGSGTVDAMAQTRPSEVLVKYGLGVDLGTTYTAAAVYVGDRVETVKLGTKRAEMPSAVYLTEDGAVLVGEAAERRGAAIPAGWPGSSSDASVTRFRCGWAGHRTRRTFSPRGCWSRSCGWSRVSRRGRPRRLW